MAEFVLTRLAYQDFHDIGRYTQQHWGVPQRDRYLTLLSAAFERLAENPHLAQDRDDMKLGLRSYLCGVHLIYFRCPAARVEILRILHKRMDAKAHFKP